MDKQAKVNAAIDAIDSFIREWYEGMDAEPIFVTIRLMNYDGESGAFVNVPEVVLDKQRFAAEMRTTADYLLEQADVLDRKMAQDG